MRFSGYPSDRGRPVEAHKTITALYDFEMCIHFHKLRIFEIAALCYFYLSKSDFVNMHMYNTYVLFIYEFTIGCVIKNVPRIINNIKLSILLAVENMNDGQIITAFYLVRYQVFCMLCCAVIYCLLYQSVQMMS